MGLVSIEGWRTTTAGLEVFERERIGATRQIGTRGATWATETSRGFESALPRALPFCIASNTGEVRDAGHLRGSRPCPRQKKHLAIMLPLWASQNGSWSGGR